MYVCVFVCQDNKKTSEINDSWPRYITSWITLSLSRPRLKVKVMGHTTGWKMFSVGYRCSRLIEIWKWNCVRWGPSYPQKGAQLPTIFGLCLLWPNGWIDQDATWYGGMPRPRPHCVRWGLSSPMERGTAAPPTFRPISIVLLWPNGRRS